MKKIIFISIAFLMISASALAQLDRIGVGLSFSEKIVYNLIAKTGNPGINVRTWIALDKRKTMFIVPSVTAYNPHTVKPNSSFFTTTYLFHGDIDFQYRIFNEKTLTVVGFAGVNYTYLNYNVELLIASMVDPPVSGATFGFGPNLGAGLEMKMTSFWDFHVNAKYAWPGLVLNAPESESIWDETKPKFLSSPLTALVIEVQAVYYFHGRGKGYRR